jgi:hypothetical protein
MSVSCYEYEQNVSALDGTRQSVVAENRKSHRRQHRLVLISVLAGLVYQFVY